MQVCENLQETALLWFTDMRHMFMFTFTSDLQLINHLFIPGSVDFFFFASCEMPSEGKFLLKINLKMLLLISQTPLSWIPWNQQMGCFDVLPSFIQFLFFSSEDYFSLASGEKMENNHYPRSESSGLAYINIDGNLACFLLSTVL